MNSFYRAMISLHEFGFRLRRYAGALIAVLLLGSCSSTALYDRLDWFARLYLERYVDLDTNQSAWLKSNLEQWARWHREEELPRYIGFLEKVETALDKPLVADDVASWSEELSILYDRILDKITPSLLDLADQLNQDQISDFLANLEKRSRKQEKKYLSRDAQEYREDIREQIERRLEYWLGSLNAEQESRIEMTVGDYNRLDADWIEADRRWRSQLGTVMQREPGWREQLAELIRRRDDYMRDRTNSLRLHNEQLIYSVIADVLNMRSSRQQEKLEKKLSAWRQDLTQMQESKKADPDR